MGCILTLWGGDRIWGRWFLGSLVPWFLGLLVSWFLGFLALELLWRLLMLWASGLAPTGELLLFASPKRSNQEKGDPGGRTPNKKRSGCPGISELLGRRKNSPCGLKQFSPQKLPSSPEIPGAANGAPRAGGTSTPSGRRCIGAGSTTCGRHRISGRQATMCRFGATDLTPGRAPRQATRKER